MIEWLKRSLASTRYFVQLGAGAWYVYDVILRFPRRLIRGSFSFVWRKYRDLWNKVTKDKYGGFVPWRGGAMLISTALLIMSLTSLTIFVSQIGLYFLTRRSELIYLNQSEEIYPEDNIHSVKGCEELSCNPETTVYFHITPRFFHHVWSVLNTGHLFYPDLVAAASPAVPTECRVISYGFRVKYFMNNFDWYPYALRINCEVVVNKRQS